jgi:hypothetical protein
MANIPPFINVQFTNKEGYLTPAMQFYNDQLNQALANAIGANGFQNTQATTAQITAIEPEVPVGTVWFDMNAAKLKVKTADGVVETITSS